jgi:hypothetical protein
VIFPEEGKHFGNDLDLGHILSGTGFVVLATKNSASEDHTNGTSVSPQKWSEGRGTNVY